MSKTIAREFRSAGVLAALLAVTSLLLVVGPQVMSASAALSGVAPDLTATLGVSTYTAKKIVDALTSPWAMALSLLLVPLGFGGWALTLRAVWAGLVTRLGAKAAAAAMISY
jgi:hypothetical protein